MEPVKRSSHLKVAAAAVNTGLIHIRDLLQGGGHQRRFMLVHVAATQDHCDKAHTQEPFLIITRSVGDWPVTAKNQDGLVYIRGICLTELNQKDHIFLMSELNSLSHVQLFVTPWNIQSMEFSRSEYWSGKLFLSLGALPDPGIKPRSPTLQADSSASEPPGKPIFLIIYL